MYKRAMYTLQEHKGSLFGSKLLTFWLQGHFLFVGEYLSHNNFP